MSRPSPGLSQRASSASTGNRLSRSSDLSSSSPAARTTNTSTISKFSPRPWSLAVKSFQQFHSRSPTSPISPSSHATPPQETLPPPNATRSAKASASCANTSRRAWQSSTSENHAGPPPSLPHSKQIFSKNLSKIACQVPKQPISLIQNTIELAT